MLFWALDWNAHAVRWLSVSPCVWKLLAALAALACARFPGGRSRQVVGKFINNAQPADSFHFNLRHVTCTDAWRVSL